MIAESRFFEIGGADWAGEVGLAVALRERSDRPDGVRPWVVANHPRIAWAGFERLAWWRLLRAQTSGWTTAPDQPFAERSAAA